jgi:Spy/CpxP family protein refolding chaperone
MRKQSLRVLIPASLMAIAASFVVAQNSHISSAQKSSPSSLGAGGRTLIQELTAQLKLTADQQVKIENIFEAERSQTESLPHDTSVSPQDRLIEIRKSTDTQIRALLDPTQQKKWDAIEAKRAQWLERPSGWTDRRGSS